MTNLFFFLCAVHYSFICVLIVHCRVESTAGSLITRPHHPCSDFFYLYLYSLHWGEMCNLWNWFYELFQQLHTFEHYISENLSSLDFYDCCIHRLCWFFNIYCWSIYTVKSQVALKTFPLRALVINSGISDTSFSLRLCQHLSTGFCSDALNQTVFMYG